MKSEELLTGLNAVGEDLLAESESGIRVSTRRPRVGAAIAAGLALLIGLGGLGFWLLQRHNRALFPSATTVTMPSADDEPASLQPFCVGSSWKGDLSGWTFDNLERSLSVNRWTLETGVDRLTVYEVANSHPAVEGWTKYSEEELLAIMSDAIERLGVGPVKDIEVNYAHDGSGALYDLEAGTELGTLTVWPDGWVQILFNEEHRISPKVKIDFAEELTVWEMDAEYRDAIMGECGEKVAELLGLPACHPAVCDRFSSLSSAYRAYLLYPVREDPAEQLKSRYLEAVRLLTVDGRTLLGLEWLRLPEAGETCAVPEDWRAVGDYPIISAEEAKQTALRGDYYCENRANAIPLVTEENLAWGELVYLDDPQGSYALPFYRFWVPCREGDVTRLMDCAPIYVPAVDSAYLLDFGPEDMPIHVEDPTAQATTEATDPGDIEETDEGDGPDPGVQDPTVGFFTAVDAAERRYFTDGQTELWLENGAVLKKDLGSGETLTLFSLEPSDEVRTELVGVTSRRLYFGWMNTDDWWAGLNVYSVDYRNQDLQDLGGGRQDVSCKDGWILLETHRTDVAMVTLRVIDRDDRLVVDEAASWGGAVVDGCVWYIYAPSLQDTAALDAMSLEERDALLRSVEYQVWLLERKGESLNNTIVHTIQLPYYSAFLQIDPEARVIKGDGIQSLDLDTLKPGAADPQDPDPGNSLPRLSLAHCLGSNGEEGKLFRDLANEIALSPITNFSSALPTELPVYQNMAYVDDSGIPVCLAREEMQRMADALVQRWGFKVQSEQWIDGALPQNAQGGSEPNPSALIVETDKATITVYGNGAQAVSFREPLDKSTELTAEWIYDPAAPLTPESAAAYAKAWAEYCERIDGLTVQCEPVYGYADMEARTYTCIYYLTEPADSEITSELKQRLLEYTFHEQLFMDEHGDLTGYRTHLVPPAGVHANYAAEPIGSYPILSRAEADQALKDGFFFTNASLSLFLNGKSRGEALLEHAAAVELVYRTGMDQYFLPYYRYWIVDDVPETAGGLTRCAAVYVPAIPREYLTDLPQSLMPEHDEDPQLAELKTLFEDENSFYGRILCSGGFPSPDLVPLGNLLSNGLPGVDNSLSAEERAELEAAATAEMLDAGVEPVKLPRAELNALLKSTLGLSLDEIQYNDLRNWVYLESRDCWYLFGRDQGGIVIEVDGYTELPGGELQLRYWRLDEGPDAPVMYVANLRKTDTGYQVLSNNPAVWNN